MSLTPDIRKVGLGLQPSPSPFYTPRPDRRCRDSRCGEFNSNRQLDRDKEVNVQVLLRCRPFNDEEQRMNVPRVISCNEQKREVTVLQSIANKQVDKVFTFDKVFGPKAQQRSIYDQAIAPIVNEVLEGYNCTVFAYGQTGTGKTYTMEGKMRNKGGDLPAEAGVILRAVRQIFDTLDAQNADYSMKVTFLELYNEEITDLLAPDIDASRFSDEGMKRPISLLEDGKGCVLVRGLEEEVVYSANDIYALLERGAARRRTADTLLNKRSSRSHSVFSITIMVKEAAVSDEEVIKCGKLNLVDLAGSENISRSGAREGRAREAGEINKSLLTLGRVINALVEHSTHIPYRDSKLTRLLRDSLGGKTKTCIIATVSPSAHSLEETLSTLDYAYRAKNIKNKPEVNQKMSKSVLLKDLYLEIERMKEDVRAAREKNGVYVPRERYAQDEDEKKARIQKIEQLENDLGLSEKQVDKFRELYLSEQEQRIDLEKDVEDLKVNLEKSNKELLNLQEKHMAAISELKEKERIISKLLHSESSLIECAKDLRNDLQMTSDDVSSLFARLDQKDKIEADNQTLILTFGSYLDRGLKDLHKTILASVCQQEQHLRSIEEHVGSYLASKCDATKTLESRIKKITESYNSGVASLKELSSRMQSKASSDLEQINFTFSSQMMAVEQCFATMVLDAKEVIEDIHDSLIDQKKLLDFSAQQQEEGLHRSLCFAQTFSKATDEFFSDIYQQASHVITSLEESQIKRSDQLSNFEKSFKDEAAREEKQALENIAAILAALTSKKTSMVSEAARNIQEASVEENQRFLQDMLNVKQISSDAKKELANYVTEVERHFVVDTFSVAETKAITETCLNHCSKRVERSMQQWENAQSSISNLNKSNASDIESTLKEKAIANNKAHEELLSVVSATDKGFDAGVREIMDAINDSFMRDQENKNEMDAMTALCMDQLKSAQENHGECVSEIRNKAENFITKDYQVVDKNSAATPRRRDIVVPSVASIERMRTGIDENQQNISKWAHNDKFSHNSSHNKASPIRAPFTDVN